MGIFFTLLELQRINAKHTEAKHVGPEPFNWAFSHI